MVMNIFQLQKTFYTIMEIVLLTRLEVHGGKGLLLCLLSITQLFLIPKVESIY